MTKRRDKPVGARHALHEDSDRQPPGSELKPTVSPEMPIWECPNCGQNYFGAHPPDLCAYCRDFTTWRPVKPGNDDVSP